MEVFCCFVFFLAQTHGLQSPLRQFGPAILDDILIRLERRDDVARELKLRDIETGVHYPHPIHRMPAFATARTVELPHVEQLSREVLSLPIHPGLDSADIRRVCSALTEVLAQRS